MADKSKVPAGAPSHIEAVPPDAKWKFGAGHIVHGQWYTVDYSHPSRKPVQYTRADIAERWKADREALYEALKEVMIDVAATKHCDLPRETAKKVRDAIAKAEMPS